MGTTLTQNSDFSFTIMRAFFSKFRETIELIFLAEKVQIFREKKQTNNNNSDKKSVSLKSKF